MNQQTKSKLSPGMILWAHLERLRKDLESVCDDFDELYRHVTYLKAEKNSKPPSAAPPSLGG